MDKSVLEKLHCLSAGGAKKLVMTSKVGHVIKKFVRTSNKATWSPEISKYLYNNILEYIKRWRVLLTKIFSAERVKDYYGMALIGNSIKREENMK